MDHPDVKALAGDKQYGGNGACNREMVKTGLNNLNYDFFLKRINKRKNQTKRPPINNIKI